MASPKGRIFPPSTLKMYRHPPLGNSFPVWDDSVMSEFVKLEGLELTTQVVDSITISESVTVVKV